MDELKTNVLYFGDNLGLGLPQDANIDHRRAFTG